MASRVPLLVKSKGRKPSRLPIAPRAKPSNAPRAKRPEPAVTNAPKKSEVLTSVTSQTEKPKDQANGDIAPVTKTAAKTAVHSAAKQAPAANVSVTKPTAESKFAATSSAAQSRKSGGISIGGSFATGNSAAPPAASKSPAQPKPVLRSPSAAPPANATKSPVLSKPTARSPVVLPVQRRPERLAKISSAGPVYRASPSPLMRPRAGSIGSSPAANPMKQRLARKLDIKPHQSPRRVAAAIQQKQQRILRQQDGPASPLMLGGKAVPGIDVPDVQLDTVQPRRKSTPAADDSAAEPKRKRSGATKRRKISETASVETTSTSTDTTPRRRSLRRQAKRKNSYREEHGSSGSEPDDDRDEDVDPNDLDLPEEEAAIYVPARERATMWAKSVLQQNDDDGEENKEGETSQALVVREKKPKRPPTRRKRSSSTSSSIISLVGGVGLSTRDRMEELLKKEPSQMTMGEIALTVPKGRRMKRHEREEAATSADTPLPNSSPSASGEGSSSLLNMSALSRVRSLSVSSESAAFAGSLVTPQVQIIDGQMVVLESTIKLGDELQSTADALGGGNYGDDNTGLPPRHSGSRYNSSHQNTPGKRWGKEETKQFYYCLSQVGPNFSMMATLFPTRKRKELKSKFKYEEKNHSKLIEIALRASAAPLDTEMVNVISQMVDKEAQRKLNAQKKKRKAKSPLDALNDDQDVDETASVMSSSIAASPMSSSMLTPVAHAEEFVETMNDEDLFLPNRRDSFDFSG